MRDEGVTKACKMQPSLLYCLAYVRSMFVAPGRPGTTSTRNRTMTDATWIRTCQECGHEQLCRPPVSYKSDSWRDLRCKRCKSMALDYGRDQKSDSDDAWD